MASNLQLSNAQVDKQAYAILSDGTDQDGFHGGTLTIYEGAQPANADTAISTQTPLVDFDLPEANNTVTNGVITFDTIADSLAYDDGTAQFFRVVAMDGTTVVCDGTVGTSDADLILNSVVITNGANVSITGFTYTVTK
jgi:hypothetical protein